MEFVDFFVKILVLLLPSLLIMSYSKDFSLMLVGFSIGVVIGIQVNVLETWWLTLSVIALVSSLFLNKGGI